MTIFKRDNNLIFICPFCDHRVEESKGDKMPNLRRRPTKGRTVGLSGDPIDFQCPECEAWVRPEDD